MKYALFTLFLGLLVSNLSAQSSITFFEGSFEEAKAQAAAENKMISDNFVISLIKRKMCSF